MQQRLGDGFYEQKLIREQIGQLTGRRFLEGYSSDEAQYQALLDAGATVGKAWGLRPGVALTAAQMAQLTSDIVWLVAQTVTLPDGRTTTALVPQVYLRLHPGDLDSGGALLAGANVDAHVSGTLTNTGTIAGRQLVSLEAGRIEHLGGSISGNQVALSSASDIDIHGASVSAVDALSVRAAGNIDVASTVETLQGGGAHQYATTQIARVAGLYVTGANGSGILSVVGGGDVTLQGAQVRNAGTDGVTQLVAGHDLTLGAQTLAHSTDTTDNARNYQRSSETTHAVSSVQGAGDVVLAAGHDVTLQAAQIGAGKTLALQAGHDLDSQAVVDSRTQSNSSASKRHSLVTSTHDEHVQGTQLGAGGDIVMRAGNDLTLASTAVASQNGGIALAAGHDVALTATQEQHDSVVDEQTRKHHFLSNKTTTTHDESHDSLAVTSSLSGDTVHIAAGNDVLSQGAQIVGTGDVVLAAGNNLTLETAQNTHSEEHDKQVKKSGLFSSGGASFTIGASKQTNTLATTQVSHTGSTVGSIDGAVTLTAGNALAISGSDVLSKTGTAIVGKDVTIAAVEDTVDTVETSKQHSAGINVGLTGAVVQAAEAAYGMTRHGSQVSDDRLKALYAVKAAYAAKDSVDAYQAAAAQGGSMGGVSVRIGIGASSASSKSTTHEESTVGSRIQSEGNVTIAATGGDLNVIGSKIDGENVALSAAHDLNLLSQQENNTQKSDNKNAGGEIGVSVGTTTGVYATAYAGKGAAKGNSTLHTESVVTAKDTLSLVSGNDTTIKGAQAIGNQVLAQVGGNLLIQSEQDSSDYKSKQQQASATVVWGFSGSSASYSQQKVNSTYTSFKEQSGIQAGDGGFAINVDGNTHLIGGAIASTADPALNHLSTGSLTVEDLQNMSKASASGFGVTADASMFSGSKYAASKGVASNALGSGSSSESHTSTTRSDIAAGAVEIGNHDDAALAGLARKASVLDGNGVGEVDQKKLQEDVEFQQQAKQLIYAQAVKVTDEAYADMFAREHTLYKIAYDEKGGLIPHQKVTGEEMDNLQPASDGKVHVTLNGIFNGEYGDDVLAEKYANQHSTVAGPKYYIHFPEASSDLAELLIAGYQKYLENDFFGLTNSTQEIKDIMLKYGQTGLHIDAHSRGSMTDGNAEESIAKMPDASGLLSNTTVSFFGPAYNAKKADDILSYLQNREAQDDPESMVLTLQNHMADPVGRLIGGNPATGGTIPEGSSIIAEMMRALLGLSSTSHNCYGSGGNSKRCADLWSNSPFEIPKSTPVNIIKKD
ncbi:hemagglutinin repeat-containing protein [Xanthomonas oryzae]|nr:hemagglutinin repeat-containing protein [Xanthomonas oryzae]